MNTCEKFSACQGATIFPTVAPSSSHQGFTMPIGENWMYPQYYGADIYMTWNMTDLAISKDSLMRNASASKYLCMAVIAKDPTDTSDVYTLTKDPNDPYFYATCMYKFQGNWFPGYEGLQVNLTVGPWHFGDMCLDCSNRLTNALPGIIPKWNIADKCIDCSYEPGAVQIPQKREAIVVEDGVRCDGYTTYFKQSHYNSSCANSTICLVQLVPDGRPVGEPTTLDECAILAARSPDCSNRYMHYRPTQKCYCYSSNPCCKSCSRRPDQHSSVYEVVATPDPTCATGILSAEKTVCCGAECGSCVSSNYTIDAVGFCYKGNVSFRPCSLFGPPCLMAVAKKEEYVK